MNNNLVFLTENPENIYNATWYIVMVIFLIIFLSPWVFIILKFGVYRKLRVRFILEDGKELEPLYLKKGAEIVLPIAPVVVGKKFIGWYIDEELTEDYSKFASINGNVDLDSSVWTSIGKRSPWLFLLLFLGFLVSMLISSFGEVISSLTTMVFLLRQAK